jgi:hypothetical protein
MDPWKQPLNWSALRLQRSPLSFDDFGHTHKNKKDAKIFDRMSRFVGRAITHQSKTMCEKLFRGSAHCYRLG